MNDPDIKKILIAVGVTLMGFILCVGSSYLIWGVFFLVDIKMDYWVVIGGLSAAVTTAALIGGAYLAFHELREAAKGRHLEIANHLFVELNSSENVKARKCVYQELSLEISEGIKQMDTDKEGSTKFKLVINSLDRVAFLTQADWIPLEKVMEWMNPMIVKAWLKVGPNILYERERRNEPNYYTAAEKLTKQCIAWREEHLEGKIQWLEDAL